MVGGWEWMAGTKVFFLMYTTLLTTALFLSAFEAVETKSKVSCAQVLAQFSSADQTPPSR